MKTDGEFELFFLESIIGTGVGALGEDGKDLPQRASDCAIDTVIKLDTKLP